MTMTTARAPRRVQRTRRPGGGMPPGARYVGRGSRWGNPYSVVRQGDGLYGIPDPVDSLTPWPTFVHEADARAEAVRLFRRWLSDRPDLIAAARRELAGWDLACWCRLPEPGEPDHCHGAPLLAVVAGEDPLTALRPGPARTDGGTP